MPPLSRGIRLQIISRSSAGAVHIARRHVSTRSRLFTVAEEVEDALATGKAVVALESYPYPENVALSSYLESLVRINGGVPATIGIVDGKAHIGMNADTLIKLISTAGSKDTWKVSRRDLGFIGGMGLRGKMINGGTTVAGTMILAHLAGIKVFATGGLGGVHRGVENTMDISADLTELGRTPVAVVSSGCKSFLDIPRTLEYLETQGVGVGTFADGRTGDVDFPAFFSRDSGIRSPQTIENEADAAAIIHAQFQLPVHSGLLLANPVPVEAAMAWEDIDSVMAQAVAEADEKGFTGSTNTPYVLKRIRELSNGASVLANRALIEANVVRGTKVAVELAKLEVEERSGAMNGANVQVSDVKLPSSAPAIPTYTMNVSPADPEASSSVTKQDVDILVAGSLACDTMCDYAPFDAGVTSPSPVLHTSNPGQIAQAAGGVGRNVATAAYYAGARVALASAVANDIAGFSLMDQVKRSGLDASHILQLDTSIGTRTAQYIAVNDKNKDLVVAVADMDIFTRSELADKNHWSTAISTAKPKWMVVDGNWSASILSTILEAAKSHKIPVALEPVSTAKAARTFDKANKAISSTSVVPNHSISIVTPNALELSALHTAAQNTGLFESDAWWQVINSFGLSSAGSRDKFTMMTSAELTDAGVPQQSIQILPYIPNVITKLGPQGVLLTSLLRTGDDRLRNPEHAPYILSRSNAEDGPIGGIYMRLFPPAAQVAQEDIVSVNGVGDTLLGVLMARIVKATPGGARLEELIPLAQEAAVLTLKSKEAVSQLIKELR